MSTQRPLTDDEDNELAKLNDAVKLAIEIRRAWLDVKMHQCSSLQIGDDIYDIDSGRKLGRISQLYRFWRNRDCGVRDTSAHCDYQYETSPGCFDNTSRQIGVSFGTQEDALRYAEIKASLLRRGL